VSAFAEQRWLRPSALLVALGLHAAALLGARFYKPPLPPALESLDLSMVAQGDDVPQDTQEQVLKQAEPEAPPEDRMAFDPLPEPDPPPVLREAKDAIDLPIPPPPKPEAKPTPPQPTPVKVVEKPKPKPKPKRKPADAPRGSDETNQVSQSAAKAGLHEGRAENAGMSRAAYASQLIAQVRAHQFYPDSAQERGLQGAATVAFSVTSGGGIGGVRIVQSSGAAELDSAARQIVLSVSAPPPPGGSFTATTTIRFRLR